MDLHIVLLLFVCVCNCVREIVCKQEFIEEPQYTEVNPGETALLQCRIRNFGGQCSWQMNGLPMRIFPGKHEWNGSPDQGDCSLKVINASLMIDDGNWICQVTASSIDKWDQLGSKAAHLVVRVAPHEPTIEFNTSRIARGHNLTTRAERSTAVKCASHYGNPPATIRWFLDDVDISTHASESNTTEPDNRHTWLAVSVLEYTFPRGQNGKLLRCLTFHEAFALKSKEISVQLNIQYPPITALQGKPTKELEENIDSLSMTCTADANPPALITWKKNGADQAQFRDKVEFSPVTRTHSGSYMCEARNSLGHSVTPTVEVDIKYPPKIKSVDPVKMRVSLTNRTKLACSAEGNPSPSYEWLHSMTGKEDAVVLVGQEPVLVVENTSYDDQGQYVCRALNIINGKERPIQSQSVTIEVYGPPQVLRRGKRNVNVIAEKGFDALICVPFCSKPSPLKVSWEWGSLLLAAGEGAGGKFVAKAIVKMKGVDGCFEAELIVQKAEPSDSRRYILKVENSYGQTNHEMFLIVQEPIAMLTVIGIVIGILLVLVITILIILFAFRNEKWCFKRKNSFSVKAGESELDGKDVGNDLRNLGTGAIPPDALYTIPSKPHVNNERIDDGSEYDSMMSDLNDHKSMEKPEVVYADLDLVNNLKGNMKTSSRVMRRESPTEYAQIQVQYRPKPDEQADI